jgi:hypothetical protein
MASPEDIQAQDGRTHVAFKAHQFQKGDGRQCTSITRLCQYCGRTGHHAYDAAHPPMSAKPPKGQFGTSKWWHRSIFTIRQTRNVTQVASEAAAHENAQDVNNLSLSR